MTKNKDATLSSQKSESGNNLNKNKEIKKLLDMGVQRGYPHLRRGERADASGDHHATGD